MSKWHFMKRIKNKYFGTKKMTSNPLDRDNGNISKRRLAIIMIFILAITNLTGVFMFFGTISVKADTGSSSGDGDGNADGKITLSFWYTQDPSSDEGLLLEQMVKEFEQLHPNISVDMVPQNFFTAHDTYKNAFLAGNQPDIFRSAEGDVTEWIYLGAILDLTDYISDEDKQDFLNISKYTAVFNYQGEDFWYGVPEVIDMLFMFYNKEIFNDAGITYPPSVNDSQGWTWDEFRQTCVSLTSFMRNNSIGDYAFNIYKELQYSFNVFLWGFGGDYWQKDENGTYILDGQHVTINSTEAINALTFLLDLKNNPDYNYRVMPEQNAGSETDFKEGKNAIVLNGPWAINSILKGSAFQNVYTRLGIAPIPGLNKTDKTPRSPVGGHDYVISYNCEHPKEAYELINYLTNKQANVRRALELGLMPTRISAYNDSSILNDPKASYFISQYEAYLKYAHVGHPKLVNWKAFASDQLANKLKTIWTSSKYTATEILNDVQRQWENNQYLTLSGGEAIRPVTYWNIILYFGLIIIILPFLSITFRKFKSKRSFKEEWGLFLKDVKSNKLAYLLVLGTTIILILEVFIPLLITLDTSFRNYTPAAESKNPLNFQFPEYIGWKNYMDVFTNELFFRILFNTIFWTLACVSLQITLGLAISMLLNKKFKGRSFYRTLLILPWAVPSYVTVYIWRVFILQDSSLVAGQPGLINIILKSLGLNEIKFLSADTAFVLPGLSSTGISLYPISNLMLSAILVNVWLGIPFVVISFTAGLSNISKDLYEAADIEGASWWQKFTKITLPQLKPTFMIVTLLGVIWTFNMFNVIYILSLNTNIPSETYSILAVWVYELAFHNFTKGSAAAVSWVIFGILLLFAMVYKKSMNIEDEK
ncbi:MAG: extracellular solute-binding protein [Promethearchaeota archaeon]